MTKLTPEQALGVLTQLSERDDVRLSKREHVLVDSALLTFKDLIPKPDNIVPLPDPR